MLISSQNLSQQVEFEEDDDDQNYLFAETVEEEETLD
jgi:hypothetical protein